MGQAKRRRDAGLMPPQGKPVDLEKAALALLRLGVRTTKATTPKEPFSDDVRRLLDDIAPGVTPVFLPFTDTHPDYENAMCHGNVIHRVREAGGSRVNGWMIWEHAKFAEAEFHTVWQSPDGQLVDVTPRKDGEAEILFLPDANTKIVPAPDHNGLKVAYTPINRCSIPDCPYLLQGNPWPYPTVSVTNDAKADELMTKLGVESIAG